MGFINNIQDNFSKSNSAWGDDNVTYYDMPTRGRMSAGSPNVSEMSYEDLQSMIKELSSVQPSSLEDADLLSQKLSVLVSEKKKRDNLEDITREERDDVFEIDIDDKEKPNDSIGDPLPETEVEEIISEPITPSISMPTKNNTNDIIIAGIIIIFVIKFID